MNPGPVDLGPVNLGKNGGGAWPRVAAKISSPKTPVRHYGPGFSILGAMRPVCRLRRFVGYSVFGHLSLIHSVSSWINVVCSGL